METSAFAYASPSRDDEVLPITITVQRARATSGLSVVTIYSLINSGELESTTVHNRRLIFYDSFLRVLGLNPDGSRSERMPYVPARYMGRMLSPEEQAARTKLPQREAPPKRRRGRSGTLTEAVALAEAEFEVDAAQIDRTQQP